MIAGVESARSRVSGRVVNHPSFAWIAPTSVLEDPLLLSKESTPVTLLTWLVGSQVPVPVVVPITQTSAFDTFIRSFSSQSVAVVCVQPDVGTRSFTPKKCCVSALVLSALEKYR